MEEFEYESIENQLIFEFVQLVFITQTNLHFDYQPFIKNLNSRLQTVPNLLIAQAIQKKIYEYKF